MNSRPPPPPLGFEDDPEFDENPIWTEDMHRRARPSEEVLGPEIAALLTRKPGRPALAPEDRKQKVNIRLSREVLETLRSGGPGWQGRIDTILRAGLGLKPAPR